jgi:hypothetical protein
VALGAQQGSDREEEVASEGKSGVVVRVFPSQRGEQYYTWAVLEKAMPRQRLGTLRH